MNPETIGIVSGILVAVSVIPYAWRTYQGKIEPEPTSWFLWSLIGLAMLLTYKSSGAKANVWPAVTGFMNPLIVFLIMLRRSSKEQILKKFTFVDKACLITGLTSLVLWFFLRNSRELSQYALYIAIFADACAIIPTIDFVWRNPMKDRPFAWCMFGFAYGLTIFAITEHTVANYVLPIYMLVGATSIGSAMVLYRIRKKIPLHEWI